MPAANMVYFLMRYYLVSFGLSPVLLPTGTFKTFHFSSIEESLQNLSFMVCLNSIIFPCDNVSLVFDL